MNSFFHFFLNCKDFNRQDKFLKHRQSGEVLIMKSIKQSIYRIWVQRDELREIEEDFFNVQVWDVDKKEYVENLSASRFPSLNEARLYIQTLMDNYPHILFKPNSSGRLFEDR